METAISTVAPGATGALVRFFGMGVAEFRRQWAELSNADKAWFIEEGKKLAAPKTA